MPLTLRNAPIRRKLMRIMLLTSGSVLLLSGAAFLTFELLTFRQTAVRQLATVGQIIATNSTAALAFQNQDDARQVLAALLAERNIASAVLFDADGRPFAHYPEGWPVEHFPAAPGGDGFHFRFSQLIGVVPVAEGDRRLGTLYLQGDLSAVYQRLYLFAVLAALVMAASFVAAWLLARKLQSQISLPILTLVESAKAVSERQDYSVRATKLGQDELGVLTDAFNQMLTRIQEQNVALRQSEERVRAVVNSALSAVIVTDNEGRIADWNTRAATMFGFDRAEVVGKKLEEVIVPAGRRDAYWSAVEHSPVETTAMRRDGRVFPVELAVSTLRTDAGMSFCSFITDITERKQAVERLHAQLARHDLLNRITRAIGERQDLASIFQVVISTLEGDLPIDFGCVFLNDPRREWLTVSAVGAKGREQAEAIELAVGSRVEVDTNGLARCMRGMLVYESDISRVDSPFTRRLSAAGLRSLIVAPLLVESSVFGALVAARGEPESFSSPDCEFVRQLSEHVALAAHQTKIYDALQQAYDDLRQSQQAVVHQERLRALGQMASGIAHDINNAISPVSLYAQLILATERNVSADTREHLETIERAAEDVAATVARLREFYRTREDQVTLGLTNLNRVAQQVLQLTQARWADMPQQHGVMVRAVTDLAHDLPLIMAAENEVREALTNLVFNAVDAMPGGGTITIRTRMTGHAPESPEQPDLREVHVEVADTGVGMDEETRRRCLDPFFTTKGERGTGLGLAMVYGMVQRHSAELAVESEKGKGTTVRLSFAVPTMLPATPEMAAAHPAFRPQRILIVDDDPLLLKSLRDALEIGGHTIVIAAGGQAGIETFRKSLENGQRFAAVITDLGMPYVDGRQVASAVKQASPETPVIMLTGWGQRMAADGDAPPHVDCVLSKPPRLRELNAALAQWCA